MLWAFDEFSLVESLRQLINDLPADVCGSLVPLVLIEEYFVG